MMRCTLVKKVELPYSKTSYSSSVGLGAEWIQLKAPLPVLPATGSLCAVSEAFILLLSLAVIMNARTIALGPSSRHYTLQSPESSHKYHCPGLPQRF